MRFYFEQRVIQYVEIEAENEEEAWIKQRSTEYTEMEEGITIQVIEDGESVPIPYFDLEDEYEAATLSSY
jgi:hypothetical protein